MTVYTRDPAGQISVLNPATWDFNNPLFKLKPIEWTWSYSEAAAPSITHTIRIPPPTLAQWAALDPAARPILLVNDGVLRPGIAYSDRSYTTHGQRVMGRVRNDDNSVTLTTVFWEQDLIDYSPPAVDRSNWANQGDVGAIIGNVLTKVYGANGWWQQGVAQNGRQLTGAFPTYQAATNLMANGSFEAGITGWTASGATISASTTWSKYGQYSLQITPTANYSQAQVTFASLSPKTKYTLSATLRMGSAQTSTGANARSMAVGFNLNGAQVAYVLSETAPNVAFSERRLSVTFTTPALLDSATLKLYNGGASGQPNVWWDGILLVEGDGLETDGVTPISYFDGNTVDGLNGYNYDWQGDSGTSASTRTPILSREPDALTWKPGQSAWDFLTPILESLGGRLQAGSVGPPFGFRWVTNRYVPDGFVGQYVEGANLYSVTQEADLSAEFSDGTPMFADGVVFRYSWTDSQGVQREAFDAYPAAGYKKPWYQELDAPYPGAGRAQGLYLRLRARASMLTIVVPYAPGLMPSRQVSVTSSQLGGSVVGIVDTVDHDPLNGTSTIRTKNTISYPTNAWLTKTTAWSALTGTWAAQ